MLRTAPSPFGGHTTPSCAAPVAARPFAALHGAAVPSHLRRCGSNAGGLSVQRQHSSSCSSGGLQSAKTLQMPRQRSSRCCAIAEDALDLVSGASAAVSSFDDVCEALGDIAKLDNLVAIKGAGGPGAAAAAAAAAVVAPAGAPVGFDLSVALSWGVEKAVGCLGSLALLEGLVDRTLIDLFTQTFSALELAGSTFDTPWLRLGVALGTAAAVHAAVTRYQAAHPAKLQRQLSPAASLSDALAEQAAAAVMKGLGAVSPLLGKQQQQQPQQQMERQLTLAMAGALPGAAVAATGFPPTITSSNSRTSSSTGKAPAVSLTPKALGPTALAGSALLLLGQVKRANKIKKQVAAVVREVTREGSWSPAALLVVIDAAALVHSYSEMASGVATLLQLGA